MLRYSRAFDAPSERDSSTSSSGVARRPVTQDTTMGKKAIRKVMNTRGRSPAPITTTMIGATATMGVDCTITNSG